MPAEPLKKPSYVQTLKQQIAADKPNQFPRPHLAPTTTNSTSPSSKQSNIIDFAAAKAQRAADLAFSIDQLNPQNAVIVAAIANGLQKDNLIDLLNGSQKNKLLTAAKIKPYDSRAIEKFAQQISQEYDDFYRQLASQYNPQLNDFQFKEQIAKTILSETEIAQLGEEISQTSQDIIDSNQPQTFIQNYFQKKTVAASLATTTPATTAQSEVSPTPSPPAASPPTSSSSPSPTTEVEKTSSSAPSRTQTLRENIAQQEQQTAAAPAAPMAATSVDSPSFNNVPTSESTTSPSSPSSASSPMDQPSNQGSASTTSAAPTTEVEETSSSAPSRTQTLRENIAQQEQQTAAAPAEAAAAATAAPMAATSVDSPSFNNVPTSESTTSPSSPSSASSPMDQPSNQGSASTTSAAPTEDPSSSPSQARTPSPKRSFARRLQSAKKKPADRLQKKAKDAAAKAAKKIFQKALQGLGTLLANILPYIWPLLVGLGLGLAGIALATGGAATIAGGATVAWTAVTAWVSSSFSPFDNATVQLANQAPAVDKDCAQCLTVTKTSTLEGGLDLTGEAIDASNAKRARFTYTITPNTDKCADIKLNGDCSDLISIACRNTNSDTCPGVDPIAYQIPETLADIIPNSAASIAVPENYRLPENAVGGTAEDGNLDLIACNALLRALKTDNLHNYPMTEPITFNLDEFLPNGYSLPYGDDYRLDNTFILGYSGQPVNSNYSSQIPSNCSASLATNAVPIIPSNSENIIWSANSATLKSWIIQKSNYKLTRIWVSSPKQQINKFGTLLKEYAVNMAASAISNNNLTGKIFLATDASGFHNETAFGKVIITNGQIIRDDQNLSQGGEGNYCHYYTFNYDGTLGVYKKDTTASVLFSDYCAKNTFSFYPPLIENSKLSKNLYSTGENRMRQGFCQIDTNNYALVTGEMDLDDVAKIMLNLGCQTGVNFDGGGSTCLYTKDTDGTEHIILGCTSRKIPDILYFNEL